MADSIWTEDLKTFADAIPAPVFVKTPDGRPVLVNSHARDFYGITQEDFLQKDMADLFGEERLSLFQITDADLLARGEDVEYREQVENAAGELRTLVSRKRLMTASSGQRFLVGIASDMTDYVELGEHHRWSLESSPQIPWMAKPDGAVEVIGSRWADVTGQLPEEASGEGWAEKVHPLDLPTVLEVWQEALVTGQPVELDFRVIDSTGASIWYRAVGSPRRNHCGEIIRWYGILENINDRKLAEEALRESEERFRLAAQATGLGIWDYDARTQTRSWSPEIKKMFGLPKDAPANPDLIRELLHIDDRSAFDNLLQKALGRRPDVEFNLELRFRRSGESQERWLSASASKMTDEEGCLTRILVTIRDITEQREASERLRHVALHDPLTGLPNRAFFQEALETAIAQGRAAGRRLGLLMLDIDHLKQINDAFGHGAGDDLLVMFGERLRRSVREDDVVARLGGDEFAVVLPDVSTRKDVILVAERIIAAMKEPFMLEDVSVDCRPSIGASSFPSHGANPEDLLKSADIALYSAKSMARGSWVFFRPQMLQETRNKRSRLALARGALADDLIAPFYQPKIELETGEVSGFEALLRWRRRSGSFSTPASIAPALEDFELAVELGDRILSRAIRDAQSWLNQGVEFGSIAINAGAAELQDKAFADRFLRQLDASGVPPSRFQLEVVETVFLGRGLAHVENTLRQLRQAGILIALDDFGTGYASLTHLQKFPVDILKIDRSFVQNIGSAEGNTAIVDAIVGLGANLGMGVVAEGIETLEQARHLRQIGCSYGQGYLFSRALPASQVPAFLGGSAQERLCA
ncbi:MAG: sensor domain-containing protein [Limimaricola soesokkakensis]|uniref:sensor domain-containing protein n=1 Tax=Limimaricola soesokkakensis TaxID=1343159 RepID=UPI0040584FA7